MVSYVAADDIVYFDFNDFAADHETLRRHVSATRFYHDPGSFADGGVTLVNKTARYLFDEDLQSQNGRNFAVPATVLDLTRVGVRSAFGTSGSTLNATYVRVELNLTENHDDGDLELANSVTQRLCRAVPGPMYCPMNTHYLTQACTMSSDRTCSPVTQCDPTQVVAINATTTSDRVCVASALRAPDRQARPWPWWVWLLIVLVALLLLLLLLLCCCCLFGAIGAAKVNRTGYFHPQSHEVVKSPTAKLAQKRADIHGWVSPRHTRSYCPESV